MTLEAITKNFLSPYTSSFKEFCIPEMFASDFRQPQSLQILFQESHPIHQLARNTKVFEFKININLSHYLYNAVLHRLPDEHIKFKA